MAKSASKKKLEHKLRNKGGFDPRMKRGDFGALTGVSMSTPTLTERKTRQESKHKSRGKYSDDYTCSA